MKNIFTLSLLIISYAVCFAQPVGGVINPSSSTVCSGTNSDILTLSGQSGTIVRWQSSTNGGSSWSNIGSTGGSLTYTYSNLTSTTLYRAEISMVGFPNTYSAYAQVVVDAASSGSISANATVCSGVNGGTLTLSGTYTSINSWAFSTNGGSSYTPIANTTASQVYSNLTTTTIYIANVTNGACPANNSSVATITVDPASVGGSTSGTTTVCASSNSGTILLTGQTGSVVRWQSSTNGGSSWTNITNTSTSYNFSNLSANTEFRAEVSSGSCPNANSSSTLISVDAAPSGTVSSNATVCASANGGTLTLSGNYSAITNWEYSTNGGSSYTTIANTTNSETYTNLSTTRFYRATISGGTCPSAKSSVATITVDAVSVGGTVSGSYTVCAGTNSGTLFLSGHSGNIVRWQSSIDGGATWTNITNTNTFYNFANITTTTKYRAVVQSGSCAAANSSEIDVIVFPVSVGGTLSGTATVCSGLNSGQLSLVGYVGNIVQWEYSINSGLNWTVVANTSDSISYSNITTNTQYRVLVQSGICASKYSNIITITVSPTPAGGTVSGNATVCSGTNNGSMILSGYSGSIVRWQSSINGGVTWANINIKTAVYNYSNLTATTLFRAEVNSNGCPSVYSANVTVTVLPLSGGGTLSPTTVSACNGLNQGTIVLSGESGNVIRWEKSIDGGVTWITVADTNHFQNYLNLTQTTKYRVVVQNGGCNPAYSSLSTINISSPSVGGTVSGNDTVCTGTNSGALTLSGFTGSILNWESSTDGGISWTVIANTSAIQNYTNLSTTTLYRAVIQNGTCTTANSTFGSIEVNPASVGGTIIGSTTVCDSITSGTLTLSGFTGSILYWEKSTNGGATWSSIANTTNTQVFSGMTIATLYRAEVKSGKCSSSTSSTGTVSIASPAVANFTSVINGGTVTFTNTSVSNNGTSSWSFGDGTNSTLTSPSHTYTSNGSFVVQLIVSDSCGGDTITKTVIISGLGISEWAYNNPNVSIYPNPFSISATIQLNIESSTESTFQLFDLYGKEVRNNTIQKGIKTLSLTRDGLPAGIYFYKIQSATEAIATGKIVIQ